MILILVILVSVPFFYKNHKKTGGESVEEEPIRPMEVTEENAKDIVLEAVESNKDVDISTIMKAISLVDFDQLAKTHGEEVVLKTFNWLETQDIEGEENILVLINLVDEFVGQEYFAYIRSITNSYINHKMDFIKALAKVPEKLESTVYALNSMRVYSVEGQDMWRDLDKISKSEELSEDEKKIGIELITLYSACGT